MRRSIKQDDLVKVQMQKRQWLADKKKRNSIYKFQMRNTMRVKNPLAYRWESTAGIREE